MLIQSLRVRRTIKRASLLLADDPESQARDHVAARQDHEHERERERNGSGRGHVVPDDLELGHEPLHADRERLRVLGAREDEGEQELTPREREHDDRRREEAGPREREQHEPEGRPAARAIGERGLLDLSWDL